VYFDFDNFKPYNDTYGFRQGDRVILLFPELLKTRAKTVNGFAGHIGGDDFFVGVKGMEPRELYSNVQKLAGRFKNDVSSFYDSEAIEKGCILAKDRDGRKVSFPLLTVSAVILELPAHRSSVYSVEEIGKKMADKKKSAKTSAEKTCVVRLNDTNELVIISNESLNGESSSGHLHQLQPKIDLSEFNSPIPAQGDSLNPLCGTEAVLNEGPGGPKSGNRWIGESNDGHLA